MKIIKFMLLLFLSQNWGLYAQDTDDYTIYSTILNEYIDQQQGNSSAATTITITNQLSNLALSRLDKSFSYDRTYAFVPQIFAVDTFCFNLDNFAPWNNNDSLGIEDNIDDIETELNVLLEELKISLLKEYSLDKNKFKIKSPIKQIDKNKINKQLRNGYLIKNIIPNREYFELSPVVYSEKFAMFYYARCENCRKVTDGFGGVVVLKKNGNRWIVLGESKIFSCYEPIE